MRRLHSKISDPHPNGPFEFSCWIKMNSAKKSNRLKWRILQFKSYFHQTIQKRGLGFLPPGSLPYNLSWELDAFTDLHTSRSTSEIHNTKKGIPGFSPNDLERYSCDCSYALRRMCIISFENVNKQCHK